MYRVLERLMSMDEAAWQRHANPWSVWTRFSLLPLLALAVWSRVWIGPASLAPIALVLFWAWYNPRAFGPPRDLDSWAARGVMGERLLLARRTHPIPQHHRRAARLLAALSLVGIILMVHGLAVLAIWPTVAGLVLAMLTKAWFVDRMVWLHRDLECDADRASATAKGPPARRQA